MTSESPLPVAPDAPSAWGDRLLTGRFTRIALAILAGAGAAFAHPPFGILPGLLGYALLMILAERSGRTRGAFWMGWLAGFAYFFVGCWWVAEAFLVNESQAWMAPFGASLLPAGLGLFWGTAAALHRRFAPGGLTRVLFFATVFCLLEWVRGHVLTGFPWNPAGATWTAGSAMSQFASVAGVYGLGIVTVAAFSAFAPLLTTGPRRGRIVTAGLGILALVGLFAFGAFRLSQAQVTPTDTLVRIVQADIDQESKWTPEAYRAIVDRYIALTGQAAAELPDVVIWPEGSLPASANDVFSPASQDGVLISQAIQPGQTLLIGLGRGEIDGAGQLTGRYFNALLALHDEGGAGLRISDIYDKHRLVPFGEYLPLGPVMTRLGIRSLVHMPADFSAGPVPAPIDLPNAPRVQPLICYESLFPGFTPARGADRPGWIANVSNDAWFGATSGPLQHLNLASYRAIETGLPVARATPTGVSAMIDPWGRIVEGQRLGSGVMGVLDVRLPAPAAETAYGRFGDLFFWIMIGLGLAIGLVGTRLDRNELLVTRF